jgi:CRP-like cAMP-binding protein
MTIQISSLKAIPYFSGLNDANLALISKHVFEKKAERNEILFFEGEPADVLYFVVEGVVKIFKTSPDGKEQIFGIIRPGDSFNDVPVIGNGANLVSAAAMSTVLLNGIKKKDLENVIKEYPQIASNIIKVLSRRVEELMALVEDFSFRRVSGRVAKILLEYGGKDGDNGKDKPRLTQQEIAAMIGTAREMVGRSLKSLEGEKAIRIERNHIIITDQETLRSLAGMN